MYRLFDIIVFRTVEFCILYYETCNFFMMCRVTYSKESLLLLRKSVINKSIRPFTVNQWNELKLLRIAKVTKRGTRGGKKSKRSIIPVRVCDGSSRELSRFSKNRISTGQLFRSRSATSNANNLIHLKKSNPHVPSANFALWNTRSLNGRMKASAFIDFVISHHIDILAVTETWFKGDQRDNRVLSDLRNALPDHVIHHIPRPTRGGGVAVLLRKGFDVVFNTPVSTFKSFEYIDLTVSSKASSIRLFVIYRPPPSKVNKLTPTMFFDEFQGLIEMIAPLPTTTVIVGDFNFHLDDLEDHDANMMRDILESASMNQ